MAENVAVATNVSLDSIICSNNPAAAAAASALPTPHRFVEEAPIANQTPWTHHLRNLRTVHPWAPQDRRRINPADPTVAELLTSLTMLSFLSQVAPVDPVIAIAKWNLRAKMSLNVATEAPTPATDAMVDEVIVNEAAEAI
jgi:hypothetical protein